MKFYKKIILILVCFIILALLLLFMNIIYAKYKTEVSGKASISISRWDIKVNDNSIKNNQDISSTITPVFPGNEYIASNIIAPTAEGYFDLFLDYTDTDVAFKYEINVSPNEESAVKDLVTTGYSVDDGEKIEFSDFNSPISETVNLSEENKTKKIRIYIVWNDDPDTSSMDNLSDTSSTLKADSSAILDVSVAFTQVAQ